MENNKVNLFIPCCVDMYIPEGPVALTNLLQKLGDTCQYLPEQTCCGRDFFMRGELESAKMLGNQFLDTFCYTVGKNSLMNTDPIVVPSSSCVSYIKKNYAELFSTTALPAYIAHLKNDMHEICDYIVNVKGISKLDNRFNHKVFYFQSCCARNYCEVSNEAAQTLLKNTDGLTFVTDPDMRLCCSAHNDFALHNNEIAECLLKAIADKVLESGAEYLTSTDPSCLQFIDAYFSSHANEYDKITVIPITEILLAHEETK